MSTERANNTRSPLVLRQLGDPVLRMQAREVSTDEVTSFEIQNIIDDMIVSMQAAGGVGLAAPQIGVSRRIITLQIPAISHRSAISCCQARAGRTDVKTR